MTSLALTEFETLMTSVDQLSDIHARLQTGPGRRHQQDAIHRAGVVLTVAAWQAYVEKVAIEALGQIEASFDAANGEEPVPNWARASFKFRKPSVTKSVGSLNTPNSQNVWQLFDWSFGFDPRPNWIWHAPRRSWTTKEFTDRTDAWLRIRHTIAHGNNLPENLPWIKNSAGSARLTLNLMNDCKRHFREKATRTDSAFSDFLQDQYGVLLG